MPGTLISLDESSFATSRTYPDLRVSWTESYSIDQRYEKRRYCLPLLACPPLLSVLCCVVLWSRTFEVLRVTRVGPAPTKFVSISYLRYRQTNASARDVIYFCCGPAPAPSRSLAQINPGWDCLQANQSYDCRVLSKLTI
jgi:hypothetical protein